MQHKGYTMLDGNNERPGIEERYEAACSTSTLKVHAERSGPGDLIIAAGWSEHQTGMALLRLHSEWTGAAKPRRMSEATVRANAEKLRAADEAARVNRERENGELARLEGLRDQAMKGDNGCPFDLAVAIMEQRKLYEAGKLPMAAPASKGNPESRARADAARWYANELRLLALSLQTRPAVWAQLLPWAQDKRIPEAQIAHALFHWLDPLCGHCDGHGLHKAKDAPVLSAKQCRACNGTGTKAMPEGSSRVLSYISHCTSQARESIGKRLRAGRN